jgi:hypothetical protein
MSKMALVAIGRRENLYAVEFVQHYQKLGFDNIFILDNNHDGEEHFEDVLSPFIESGFVKILDYRNQVNCQMRAYTEVYAQIKDMYDWIAFYDFDEFLFVNGMNAKEWLKGFPEDCEEVLTNWMCMTDNNLVTYDDRPLVERFKEAMQPDRPIQYQFPDNCHVKSIIKGGLNVVFGGNPHVPDTPLVAYNASGIRCNNSPWQPIDWSTAHLRHFTTKTIEEWMTNKMKKGTPDREPSSFLPFYRDRFFKINQVTKEKLDWLNEHGYSV